MKRYLIVIITLITVINSGMVFASEIGELGFNYYNSNIKFNDTLEGGLALKEIRGGLDLKHDISVDLGYTFATHNDYANADLKGLDLRLTKDFIKGERTSLALGAGVNYSNFNTSFLGQELFTVQNQGVNLVFDFDKSLTDKINLFASGSYGLLGDYKVKSPFLEDYPEVEKLTDYLTDRDYNLQAGFNFQLTDDLEVGIGYQIKEEEIENDNFSNITINGYDLLKMDRSTSGIFFGAKTTF